MTDEDRSTSQILLQLADILEEHLEDIFTDYERRLRDLNSFLVVGEDGLEETSQRLKAHTYFVLRESVAILRGKQSSTAEIEDEAIKDLLDPEGKFPNLARTHPDETFLASLALSETAISVALKELPSSSGDAASVVRAAVRLQGNILERFARSSLLVHLDRLLNKVNEAQAEERRRISRELHDRVAHSVGVVRQNLLLYDALREGDPSQAETKLKLATEMTAEALGIISDLSKDLREPDSMQSLETALTNLLEASDPQGIQADLSVIGDEGLIPPRVRVQLFLILREAIKNVIAHAEAQKLLVDIYITPELIRAGVEDNGRGFDPEDAGLENKGDGLKSMKERASLVGGEFNLGSTLSGDGTKIEVLIPLERK